MCSTRVDLGTLGTGSSTGTDLRQLPSNGQEDWFIVRFPENDDLRSHGTGTPQIAFGTNDNNVFRFDLFPSCGAANPTCGDGGTATALTMWAFNDNCNNGMLTDCSTRSVAWPATVLIRVRRVNGGTDCGRYNLVLSRGRRSRSRCGSPPPARQRKT